MTRVFDAICWGKKAPQFVRIIFLGWRSNKYFPTETIGLDIGCGYDEGDNRERVLDGEEDKTEEYR